jgi:hypothetical protein
MANTGFGTGAGEKSAESTVNSISAPAPTAAALRHIALHHGYESLASNPLIDLRLPFISFVCPPPL